LHTRFNLEVNIDADMAQVLHLNSSSVQRLWTTVFQFYLLCWSNIQTSKGWQGFPSPPCLIGCHVANMPTNVQSLLKMCVRELFVLLQSRKQTYFIILSDFPTRYQQTL